MAHKNFSAFKGTVSQVYPKDKVVYLTIMTAEDYITKEGEKKTTFSYVPLIGFGHEANTIKGLNLEKGDLVMIFAKCGTNKYEKDGKTTYTPQIVIEEITLRKKGTGEKTTTKGSFDDATSFDDVF